jgi:hypothetical protein
VLVIHSDGSQEVRAGPLLLSFGHCPSAARRRASSGHDRRSSLWLVAGSSLSSAASSCLRRQHPWREGRGGRGGGPGRRAGCGAYCTRGHMEYDSSTADSRPIERCDGAREARAVRARTRTRAHARR